MDRDSVTPSVESPPNRRAAEQLERHRALRGTSTTGFDTVWDVTADAIGPFFTDVDGNVFMDFTSQVAAMPLGYNNPEIVERIDSLDLGLDPLKVAGSAYYYGTAESVDDTEFLGPIHLMERLVSTCDQYDMDNVFLSNSGAEAIENAIKICYDRGGHRGVTFRGAFHGRTLGALSLNRSKQVHRRGFPEIPGVIAMPYCTCKDECTCGWETDGPSGNVLGDALDPLEGSLPPEEVAYIVLEPFQGEGGYRIPSDSFVDDVATIADRYDISLICDEIQSGLGRTGEFWGVDHLDLEPDVITSAKGLRVGATVSRSDHFPEETSRIASTWGSGDVVDILQGALTIEVILSNDLPDNAQRRGRAFQELLRDECGDVVTDVRGRGLMIAIEFESKEVRDDVSDETFERGLLTLGCGHKSLRLLPPLDVTERELEMAVEILTDAMQAA